MPKPKWLEPVEQFAHFWMGFGARLVYLDYLLWRREFVKQWPPGDPFTAHNRATGRREEVTQLDRVLDTATDLRWMFIGGTVAEPVRWGLLLAAAWWFWWR